MSDKHTYVVVEPKCDSEFHSSNPASAAGKAYKRCFRKSDKKSHTIKVARKDDGKVFSYSVKRVKDNKKVMRDGVMVHYKYSTKVRSLNRSRSKSRSRSRSVSRSRSKSRKSRSRSRSRSRSKSRR